MELEHLMRIHDMRREDKSRVRCPRDRTLTESWEMSRIRYEICKF